MLGKIQKRLNYIQKERQYKAIFQEFKQHTMVPENWYVSNLKLAERALKLEGTIVECGVWKGGMIGGIAKVLGANRNYYLYDSFEGLPDAKAIDGKRALDWQKDTENPAYHDNCFADYEDAEQAMQIAGAKQYEIHKGWFEESLSKYSGAPIALLRLDGDWYDSTMTCLKQLFQYVEKDGIIIIDDYYFWDGCTRAVHDFLAQQSETYRIRTFNNQICWIKKT